jgi:predicted glutamine amidotransferase
MCRFLVLKSVRPVAPRPFLEKFADMAERSRAPDGDRQGDGWGISWTAGGDGWRVAKSLSPIWEDASLFDRFPECTRLCVHARSASFPRHKANLAFNQPYVSDSYAFLFNGLLTGVSLPSSVAGEIGSQKLWSLLALYLGTQAPDSSLRSLQATMEQHSRRIQAFNVALCDRKNIYAYCGYESHAEYYHLQHHVSPDLAVICSEELEGFQFSPVPLKKVLEF